MLNVIVQMLPRISFFDKVVLTEIIGGGHVAQNVHLLRVWWFLPSADMRKI